MKKVGHSIPDEVKKDLQWWNEFLPKYNGISLMYLGPWSEPDTILSCDGYLEGRGGFGEGIISILYLLIFFSVS